MLFAEYRKKIVTQASILFLVSLVVILVVPSFLHAHPERELIHDLLDLLLVVVTVLFLESVGTRRWVVVMGGTVILLKVVDMIFNRPASIAFLEFDTAWPMVRSPSRPRAWRSATRWCTDTQHREPPW